jgi:hypothetical protein
MSLCPELEVLATMTDEEFWAHVFQNEGFGPDEDDYAPDREDLELERVGLQTAPPCPECGTIGACGYDDEGRPMIHAVLDHDDAIESV